MATTDPGSAIGQSQNLYGSFSQYFSAVAAYLQSGGSGTCPEFSDVTSGLDYSNLHSTAVSGQVMSANYTNAASVENVHQTVAVLREYGIRTKSKTDYYDDAQTDTTNESNFYSTMKTYYTSMLQGVYTPGATS